MSPWRATRDAGSQSATSPTSASAHETIRRIQEVVTPSPTGCTGSTRRYAEALAFGSSTSWKGARICLKP